MRSDQETINFFTLEAFDVVLSKFDNINESRTTDRRYITDFSTSGFHARKRCNY